GAAGLQYAVAVARVQCDKLLQAGTRPLIALDPAGDELAPAQLPARALLAFGSERRGLSPQLLGRADARIRIPMRAGVSSLHLAPPARGVEQRRKRREAIRLDHLRIMSRLAQRVVGVRTRVPARARCGKCAPAHVQLHDTRSVPSMPAWRWPGTLQ